MDTRKIEKFINTFALHILTVIAGLLLVVNPDGAMALVTKLIGWLLVIAGALQLVVPTLRKQKISTSTWVLHGLAILMGILLLVNPLLLADGIGRIIGILLLMEGIRNLRIGGFGILTALTIVGGVVLILMPRTLTPTVLAICGIVMMVIGVLNILGKLREQKRLESTRDPNIIDADM